MVNGERQRGTSLLLGGVPVPARYGWVLQLVLSHLCAPDSSFPGHLCGVVAGLAYVYGLEPRELFGGEGFGADLGSGSSSSATSAASEVLLACCTGGEGSAGALPGVSSCRAARRAACRAQCCTG